MERTGPIAFYSEWVKAWKRDTSKDAIKKHFEETGEDENTQMIEMFQNQTEREFRIMMGTDIRIRRDPLAMRMREDQIKQSIHSKADKFVWYFNFIHRLLCCSIIAISCTNFIPPVKDWFSSHSFLKKVYIFIFWFS